MKKIISTDKAPQPIGPYSQAVMVNGTLYVSGQIPLTPEGDFKNNTIDEATIQVMKNIEAIVHEAGLDFSHVVKSTIFVKDLADFVCVNEVYGRFFIDNFPARETVQVVALPKNALVEISVVAVL